MSILWFTRLCWLNNAGATSFPEDGQCSRRQRHVAKRAHLVACIQPCAFPVAFMPCLCRPVQRRQVRLRPTGSNLWLCAFGSLCNHHGGVPLPRQMQVLPLSKEWAQLYYSAHCLESTLCLYKWPSLGRKEGLAECHPGPLQLVWDFVRRHRKCDTPVSASPLLPAAALHVCAAFFNT